MHLGKVKAVLFDIDDTLLDRERAQRETAGLMARQFPGLFGDFEVDRITEAFLESDRLCLEEFYSVKPGTLDRTSRLGQFLGLLGLPPGHAEALTLFYVHEYPRIHAPVPNAEPVVRALAARFPLGVVSNGLPDVQYQKLESLGLRDCFRCVVLSEEFGVRKPDARIFEEAARCLSFAPADCLYVGDSYERDVLGARAAGMAGCWFNPKGVPLAPDRGRPDLEIRDLSELLPQLAPEPGRGK